ncbi:MAG: NAD(+)/NADH kinase [Planctomycetota bacterium]
MTDRPSAESPAGPRRWGEPERWEEVGCEGRNVLVLADGDKAVVVEEIDAVAQFLRERGAVVEVQPNVRELAAGAPFTPERAPFLVVVLGGDGSVLTAARLLHDAPVPTIGINFGRVGFLASLEGSAWREGLSAILDGRALVEYRMRVEARVERADGAAPVGPIVAMNDVVISRGGTPSMIAFDLSSAGLYVASYRADGLIFATPSGSTAYSLAAGGPILDPRMRAVVATPISAHALSHRPLVLDADAPLEARLIDASGPATLDVDGRLVAELAMGDRVTLSPASARYPLLTLESLNPWKRLRDRLGWAGRFDGA